MTGLVRIGVAGMLAAAVSLAVAAGPSDDKIAELIRQLGDPQYGRRERAAAELDSLGAAAIDQLLAAAEMSDDLEVALRASWLVESIPVDDPGDAPEARSLLQGYKTKPLADRVVVMHWLLRLDDDTGITPLARIARLDRDATASRVATALLVREWTPGDPYWPGIAERIAMGFGSSQRPTARLLSSLISFSQADSADGREVALGAARDVVAALDRSRPAKVEVDDDPEAGDDDDSSAAITRDLGRTTQRIFERCLMVMLVETGRTEEARGIIRTVFADFLAHGGDDTLQTASNIADTLVWAATHGLPDVVDDVPAAGDKEVLGHFIVQFAKAICERGRNNDTEAERVARNAFEKEGMGFVDRLRAGILLQKWGAGDWASREYSAVVDGNEAPAQQQVLASVMYAEFLHDRGRDGEAAGVLDRLVGDDAGERAPALRQLDRDPAQTRARADYFRACAASLAGDTAAQRRALEAAASGTAPDVDALITLYHMPDNTPEQRQATLDRIHATVARMEDEIKQVPEDPNTYNEYAWLVSNTEGDFAKALRFSRRSLRESFDNASYLDTLAHCHAAVGDFAAAIRTQRLAMRHEPHNRIIRLNLEAFEARAAAEQPAATP
jgi:tetratricopeptide (TPR) repeat protein